MRKMISVLLAGVRVLRQRQRHLKKQNLLLRQEPRLRKVVESVLCV